MTSALDRLVPSGGHPDKDPVVLLLLAGDSVRATMGNGTPVGSISLRDRVSDLPAAGTMKPLLLSWQVLDDT